ncbi:MAG: hypothetical protein OXG49_00650 [Chloroflexi bacterium]|nr:hypothetical protein [Chloroflexota bacterium]
MTRIWNLRLSIFGSYLRIFRWRLRIRASLWRDLSRDASHPVATHLRRQMNRGRYLPVLRLSLALGIVLLILLTYSYAHIEHLVVWLLPVWLMLFSASYCAIWIIRIVPLMSRQSILGVLDEISVIPPGRVFVYLTVCKVVLNQDDAVVWLGLLRRVLAGMVLLVLLMTLCIALTLLSEHSILDLAAILLDLVLAAALIWLEHSQSTVLACLIAVEASIRLQGNVDKTSIAVVAFALMQVLCYAFTLAVVIGLEFYSLGFGLLLFLLTRELLVSALWRMILNGANEEMGYLASRA